MVTTVVSCISILCKGRSFHGGIFVGFFDEHLRVLTVFVAPFPIADGMSLSPPFIMSAAIATTGIMAAGTADGRLWLGFGGEKTSETKSSKKKRTRKWDGFNPDDEHLAKVAEGPIVAM